MGGLSAPTNLAIPGPIGGTTPSTGAFTTLSATGQITSTLATGTAPFVVASTTVVTNLNASSLGGATFAAPGAIGGGTPSTAAFTTVTGTSFQGIIGNVTPAPGTFTTVTGNPFVSATANPATTGTIRLANNEDLRWRNAANSANKAFIVVDASNNMEISALDAGSITFTAVAGSGNAFTFRDSNGIHRMDITGNGSVIVSSAADRVPLTISGYSVTGSGASSLASYTGTLNTSGVTHVNDWSITNTASGAGSTLFRIRAGAAGATAILSVTTPGQVLIEALKTTGAATGKTVVCVDTTTGQLYASSSGVACAN